MATAALEEPHGLRIAVALPAAAGEAAAGDEADPGAEAHPGDEADPGDEETGRLALVSAPAGMRR
jgi:hypothetical protein